MYLYVMLYHAILRHEESCCFLYFHPPKFPKLEHSCGLRLRTLKRCMINISWMLNPGENFGEKAGNL